MVSIDIAWALVSTTFFGLGVWAVITHNAGFAFAAGVFFGITFCFAMKGA